MEKAKLILELEYEIEMGKGYVTREGISANKKAIDKLVKKINKLTKGVKCEAEDWDNCRAEFMGSI